MAETKTPLSRGGSDSLQLAKSTAAKVIAKDIEAYNDAIRACLEMWKISIKAEKFSPANGYLEMAAELGQVSGTLGDMLAKMKSETRQHIRVERVARETVNAASRSAHTSGNTLGPQEDSRNPSLSQGEGGCIEDKDP